ncbi:MAG TPA: hypothetical protein VK588_06635 [Chitinophagaceae bacterium]|nr:hypothetical protein [Chitinophagaceae bacterium]
MKKIMIALVIGFIIIGFSAGAQETKTKPLTTPSDKIHNMVHPGSKIQHGTKYKHKAVSGKKTTTTVKGKEEALEPKKKIEKNK